MKLLGWLSFFFPFLFLGIDDPAGGGGGGTPAGGGDGSQGQVSDEALKSAGIESTADGFRLVINPDDPHSTVYTGKTVPELLNNWKAGTSEKDRVIAESKTTKESFVPASETTVPDEQKMYNEVAQRYGLDLAMFSWNDDDWKRFELDKGSAVAVRAANRVDALRNQIQTQITQARESNEIVAINSDIVTRETTKVEELCKEFGIPEKDFESEFEKVLDGVLANEKNYVNGVLDTGVIVQASAKAMRTFLSKNEQTRLQQELVQQEEQKKRAASGGPGASPGVITIEEAPTSYDAARTASQKAGHLFR